MSSERLTSLAALRLPFPENQVGKLPKPYRADSQKGNCQVCGGYHGLPAMHLDFVGHAALTDRFLDTDPEWSWEPLALTADGLPAFDKLGGLWIKLTLCGVTRLGYGDAGGKTGTNAVKETIGDALRNAGMRFGAALDLWHKGDLHDAADSQNDTATASSEEEPQWVAYDDAEPFRAKLEAAGTLGELASVAQELRSARLAEPDRVSLLDVHNTRKAELTGAAA